MSQGSYEQEEYLEPTDDELAAAARNKKLIVLAVMAVLVIAGVVLANKLRTVSRVEDCLMARGSHCDDMVEPPKPANLR